MQPPTSRALDASTRGGSREALVAELWTSVASGSTGERCRALLERIDARLRLLRAADGWVITYEALEARGTAEQLAESAPRELALCVGRPALPWPSTCRRVLEETGVDVSAAKVRAGFTRGHLLEVVVALPSHPEAELAAELAVEGLLGEAFVDDWVLAVGTQPLLRGGPLRVVQDGAPAADMHPLPELSTIAERAVSAIDGLLPSRFRHEASTGAEWTLLEMKPGEGAQGSRVLATTCSPELVKCALEGMPFHSRRFSKLGERFVWLATDARAPRGQRQAFREMTEARLDAALREHRLGAVIGTGFGERQDYVDLCLAPAASARDFTEVARDPALRLLREILRDLHLGGSGTVVGFYDTRFAEARLEP